MKKLTFLIIITINTLTASSQGLKLGIVANPQFSWLSPVGTNDVEKDKIKAGLDIGLSLEKYFTENYAFLTGLSLNNVGGGILYTGPVEMKINDENTVVPANYIMDFSLQYIKIPLALKFKTKEIGYFSYFAQIGLEAGINVKANVTIDDLDISSQKTNDEVNIFDAGYLIGGGIEYNIVGSTSAILGIQYQNGIIDAISTTSDKIITPRVSVLIGIMF